MAAARCEGYQKLDDAKRQIRLIRIWRSPKDQAELHASLQTTDLYGVDSRHEPAYWALSYYWGMPGRNKPLVLNSTVISIRENLYSCLMSYTEHFDENALLWVDVLCINQFDDLEKNSQVSAMAEIYLYAIGVVAYLGEDDADSDLIFRTLTHEPKSPLIVDGVLVGLEDQHFCFQQLFSRPYWRRLWTVQERKFARRLLILCGDQLAPWESLKEKFAAVEAGLKHKSGEKSHPQYQLPKLPTGLVSV